MAPAPRPGGALRWLSWSLALSGALSVVAFGLYALGVGAAGTLSVVSGALTAVFGAAALVHGVRLVKLGSWQARRRSRAASAGLL